MSSVAFKKATFLFLCSICLVAMDALLAVACGKSSQSAAVSPTAQNTPQWSSFATISPSSLNTYPSQLSSMPSTMSLTTPSWHQQMQLQAQQLQAQQLHAQQRPQQQPLQFSATSFDDPRQTAMYSSMCQSYLQNVEQQRQDLLNQQQRLYQDQQQRLYQDQQLRLFQYQQQQFAIQQQMQFEQQFKYQQDIQCLQQAYPNTSLPAVPKSQSSLPMMPSSQWSSNMPSLTMPSSRRPLSPSMALSAPEQVYRVPTANASLGLTPNRLKHTEHHSDPSGSASPDATSDVDEDLGDFNDLETADDGNDASKRRFWTSEDYLAVIEAYRTTHDAHLVARKLGMPASTAKSIIGKFRRDPTYTGPKKRGGPFHQVYSKNEFMGKLLPWLEAGNSHSTLNDMIEYLKESSGKVPSRSTLANWLEGELIVDSTSSMHARSVTSDTEAYSKWISDDQATRNSIFIGSQHVSMWSKRCRGQVGRAAINVPLQKNVHVVCLVAVSPRLGTIALRQVSGSVTAQDMTVFVRSVLDIWASRLPEDERPDACASVAIDQFTMLPGEFVEDLNRNSRHTCRLIPRTAGGLNPLHAILDSQRKVLRDLYSAARTDPDVEEANWAIKMKARSSLLSSIIDEAWEKMTVEVITTSLKSSALLACSSEEPPPSLIAL